MKLLLQIAAQPPPRREAIIFAYANMVYEPP